MFWYKGETYASLWDCNKIGNNGVSVRFSTSEKKPDGTYENSNWDGVAFKESAEILKRLSVGDRFVIHTAKISVRSYEKDGVKYYPTSVVLIDIDPVSSEKPSKNKSKNTPAKSNGSTKRMPVKTYADEDEDSPW